MNCSQCDRTAVAQLNNGALLCVEHYYMLANATNEQQRNHMAMMNYYRERIYETLGAPPSPVRINIPTPIIANSPVTYNNIH
jgi:hypothetical protein